jgi:hypothetical protein
MKGYSFRARVNKYDTGFVELDPIHVSIGGLGFSKGSQLQRTLKLKNGEIVNITISRC